MNCAKLRIRLFLPLCVVIAYTGGEVLATEGGKFLSDQAVVMADGIALSTDIYLPAGAGPFPCILIRTPYNKDGNKGDGEWFQKKGIAVVAQDCRGKFKSPGKFYPMRNERSDGLATVTWIRTQDWFNGKIGGWGGSYLGYTQWAVSDRLDVITPLYTGADLYDVLYPTGRFSLGLAFLWGFAVDAQRINAIAPEKLLASFSILPLSSAAEATYGVSGFMDDWLQHTRRDEYWRSQSHRGIAQAAVLSMGGWYDIFLLDQLADFEALKTGTTDRYLVINHFCHGAAALKKDYGGPAQTGNIAALARRFMIKHLKDAQTQVFEPPFRDNRYNLFIMERNDYYGADHWPPKATSPVDYYIGPAKHLSSAVSQETGSLVYRYDPADPYPNLGGTAFGMNVGPALQNSNVGRTDQVVFESSELETPLVLLGPISATLYVSSDVKNTDFYVCVQDVFEDGTIVNIQEGGAAVRFDNSEVKPLNVNIWATGYQLGTGHKLRAVICSSWFPRFNRTLNSGEPLHSATKITAARQTIHFGPDYASHITLPILKLK